LDESKRHFWDQEAVVRDKKARTCDNQCLQNPSDWRIKRFWDSNAEVDTSCDEADAELERALLVGLYKPRKNRAVGNKLEPTKCEFRGSSRGQFIENANQQSLRSEWKPDESIKQPKKGVGPLGGSPRRDLKDGWNQLLTVDTREPGDCKAESIYERIINGGGCPRGASFLSYKTHKCKKLRNVRRRRGRKTRRKGRATSAAASNQCVECCD
jgi:hypothetical protein